VPESSSNSRAIPPHRVVASGLRFPEGPIALADGSLLLVEIARGCLSRVAPDGSVTVVAQLGGGPNGAAIGPDGACYVCNNGGFTWHEDEHGLRPIGVPADYDGGRIERVDLATGAVRVLYREADKGRLCAPNDIVFDRHGGFWFTDSGKRHRRQMDYGAVYYAAADGSAIRAAIYPFMTANGIGLSADEDRLYVAETLGGRIWEFDIVSPGRVARAPWPSPNGGRLLAGLDGYRPFDSLALDAAGNVCAATLYDPGLVVLSPEGQVVADLGMPDLCPTNICFGGPGLATAYVTLSHGGRLIALDWPRSGQPLNFVNR